MKIFVVFISMMVIIICPISMAEPVNLGKDINYQYIEDKDLSLTLDSFVNMNDEKLKTKNSLRSLGYTESALWVKFKLPAELFTQGDRWLQLGPNFLDELTLYYRVDKAGEPWEKREAGDLVTEKRGDIEYRFPVFILPSSRDQNDTPLGYEVVLRAASTSAVVINAKLWSSKSFVEHATVDSAFWSLYFGVAFISTLFALILALYVRTKLLWSIFLFSLNFVLVACVQGYIAWFFGLSGLRLQHYLTSILTLLVYTSLFWMCTEVLNIKKNIPWVYNIFIIAIVVNVLLQLSIPFDFYNVAVELQGVFVIVTSFVYTYAAIAIWKREKLSLIHLFIGFLPAIYLIFSILTLLSLYGVIPFVEVVYVSWQYSLLVNIGLVLWLAVSRIVTEHNLAQEKSRLERDLKVERETSFYQRQFIGVVSHEFRTPLSIISSTVQNLLLVADGDRITNNRYNKIQRAVRRLTQLTDNCLADSRLDASSLVLQLDASDLSQLIRDSANLLDLTDNYELKITHNQLPVSSVRDLPVIDCLVDRAMLKIALSNLLENAVKYTIYNTIHIDIEQLDHQVYVYIEDQGPGIPADQAELIFQRYRRIDSPQKEIKGTGLGLYVAREIALAHGGDIQLLTYQPDSCRFRLRLPNKKENNGQQTDMHSNN